MSRRLRVRFALAVPVLVVLVAVTGWLVLRGDDGRGTTPLASSGSPGSAVSPSAGKTSPAVVGGPDWVVRENALPGSTRWQIPVPRVAGATQLAGYADQVSVLPGSAFRLFVTSTLGDWTVRAYRLGWYGGKGAREVWKSGGVHGVRQPAAQVAADRTVTTRWRPSLTVPTAGWPAGTYLLVLQADGKEKYVPITVRSPVVRNRLVILNAVTTYQAYNTWGGYSLYYGPDKSFATRSHRVSFDRPYDGNGAGKLLGYEAAAIQRAERQGLPLAYLTSLDLDSRPTALAGARGVVSLGHDEYWTVGMRRAVEDARDAGTNVAFLGANAVYWRVRFENGVLGRDRMLAGYKSAALDPVKGKADTTAKWRQDPDPDPENSLVGMLYECFPAQGALHILTPNSFLFAHTGAVEGRRYPGLVGTEIDRAYPISGTPKNLQVLAHSPVACAASKHTWSDMTYYSTSSGAGVFASGTMLWVRGLRGPDATYGIDSAGVAFVRQVTSNLLAAMAAGPMGRQHPAKGNLGSLGASASTRTGTGGAVAGAPGSSSR